jgi:hypothetical protein
MHQDDAMDNSSTRPRLRRSIASASLCLTLAAVLSSAACGFASSPDPQAGADAGSGGDGAQASDGGDYVPVELRETADDSILPQGGVICNAPGGQSTQDETFVRTFRLADWGNHGGAFEVTSINFLVTSAKGAGAVLVGLGTYGGAYGQASLDSAQIAPLASVTVGVADVADPLPPEQVLVPISAEVGAGEVLLVTIRVPSLQPTQGNFHLGATGSPEAAPGYFESAACAIPYRSTQALGIQGHLVIDVIGRWLTR